MADAKNAEVLAAWEQVDAATTGLGARIQTLIDEINNTAGAGLDGPQTEAVLARLAALVTALDGMGSNPGSPIPPTPTETPLPGPFANERSGR